MRKLNYRDIITIMDEFKLFISDKKESTQNQYVDIVKEYLLNEVLNQIEEGEYEKIFTEDRILDFQQHYRRSKIVRFGLNKFKEFLIEKGKLDKHFTYEYKFFGQENKISKEVIPLDDVKNIVLGKDAIFRNQTEKVVTQCMSAICYFCLFEQRHIQMLKCSDVLINEARIRNVRVDDKSDDGSMVKWIHIDEEIIKYIIEYIDYFNIDMSTDELFFKMPDYEVFDNICQNRLFSNYKLKGNGFLTIGGQTLNYSMIYHYLVATKGRGVADIIQIVGFSNMQLRNAMKDYISDYGVIYNPSNIGELLSMSGIEESYKKAEEVYESNIDIENEEETESEDDWTVICNNYSEENDMKMDDILLYDSMSENNQRSKDVELSRLVRNTYLAENLKLAYNNRCQLCGTRLMRSRFDAYSEAHHIRPYNKIHKGDDTIGNMIVLCSNCHSQFDSLYYAIHPNTRLVYCQDEEDRFHLTKMEFIGEHILEEKYLTYTWKLFKKK